MAVNYFTVGVIAISALCVILGVLLGLFRGFSRSVVRLILVAASAVAAWLLRPIISKWLMALEVGGSSINGLIEQAISGAENVPQSVVTLAYALIEILIGLVAFLVVFLVLKLLTYLILFPIIKIFLGREKKGRLLGALVGLIQGVFVAFVLCVPFTGIIGELNNISQIDFSALSSSESSETTEQNPVKEAFAQIGLDESTIEDYLSSPLGKFYATTGKPVYVLMTTTTDRNGNKITLSAAVGAAKNGVKMVANTKDIMDAMQEIGGDGGVTKENVGSVCDRLRDLDEIKNDTTVEEAEIINSVIKDVLETVASSGASEEQKDQIKEVLDNLGNDIDIKNIEFGAAADAVETIVKISEIKSSEDPEAPAETVEITQDDADKIVNGLAKNEMLVTLLETQLTNGGSGTLAQIKEADRDKFLSAIDNIDDESVSAEYKEKMKKLLGLIASGEVTDIPEVPDTPATPATPDTPATPETPSEGEASEAAAA